MSSDTDLGPKKLVLDTAEPPTLHLNGGVGDTACGWWWLDDPAAIELDLERRNGKTARRCPHCWG